MPKSRTSRSSGRHTPTVSTPATRPRPPSPLSPARKSRLEEKQEMQGLNNRLAEYIDKVRSQQLFIANLEKQISSTEEVKTTEITQMRSAYHAEVETLRAALDETAKEKARQEIAADKYKKEARELGIALKEKEKAYDNAAKELKNLQSRFAVVQSDLYSAEADVSELKPENAKLKRQLADAKKNLEEETLQRIDLQNQLQSAQENFKFEKSMVEQELNDTKTRRTIEITEIDGQKSQEYEAKLAQNLQEIRESYETQMAENAAAFDKMYDDKVKALQQKLDEARMDNSTTRHEWDELESKVSSLTTTNKELQTVNTALNCRVSELQQKLDDMEAKFKAELARKNAEVKSKDEQMDEMLKDYKGLMEIKVALDMEIANYRKLLESEESRMGMSGSASPSVSSVATPSYGSQRGVKRKRIMEEEEVVTLASEHSGKGDVVIEPIDVNGAFVAIRNKMDVEVNIGGWTLSNNGGDDDDVTYKFHRTTTLQPGEVCTVYSSDSTQTHEPPLNLVMKKGGWRIGDENITALRNKDGEEEAMRHSRKEKSLHGTTRYTTASQMYSQGGDPEDNKSCSIM